VRGARNAASVDTLCAVNLLPKLPPAGTGCILSLFDRDTQRGGQQELQIAEVERVAVDLEHAVGSGPGDRAGRLHRHASGTAPVQGLLDDKIRAAERGGDVTELECPLVPELAVVVA
jgi:hypothetical protein